VTREDLFRAVGEVREDQIEGAEAVKKQTRPWRRYGALAACLALIMTAAAAAPWIQEQIQWRAIIYSFNPGGEPEDAGTGSGDIDGSDYSTDAQTVRPSYSKNVEIGELDGVRYVGAAGQLSLETKWLSQEELFAQDTAIFRGTVQELQYFQVTIDGMDVYYTRALVEVTDPIRGDLTEGEAVSLLWLGAKTYLTTSLSGPLDEIQEGSDAIFMPARTTPETGETGWGVKDGYFCYADLADYYLPEGTRYVFADTGEGLEFDRSLYTELAEAETMDDLAAGIRALSGAEQEPRVSIRVGRGEPPTDPELVWLEGDPSKTVQPSAPSGGPDGAKEAGAVEKSEKTGVSP